MTQHSSRHDNPDMGKSWRVIAGLVLCGWVLCTGLNLVTWFHVAAEHSGPAHEHHHEAATPTHEHDPGDLAEHHDHEAGALDASLITRVPGPTVPLSMVACIPVRSLQAPPDPHVAPPILPPRPPTSGQLERHPVLLI